MKKTLLLFMALLASFTVFAQTVTYVDANGETKKLSSLSYTTITDQTELTSGWYLVNRNVTIDSRITINGEVHLILADGYSLSLSKGISLMNPNKLYIYGQSASTGSLTAGPVENGNAGIGGTEHLGCGYLEINGGKVTATGGYSAAGIGGGAQGNWAGEFGHGGTVVINGGSVTAKGDGYSAGIGGGGNDTPATSAIPGNGGSVTINGGSVTATGGDKGGYGIGPGKSQASGVEGPAGTLQLGWKKGNERIYISSVKADVTLSSPFINSDTNADVTADNVSGFTLVPKRDNTSEIPYIDADGNEQTLSPGSYTLLTKQTELSDGYYVVGKDVTIDTRITINGTVHLVLCDGCQLNARNGIRLGDPNELHIYGQQTGTGTLTAGPGEEFCAGIGGDIHETGGKLEVNGGTVTASAGRCAAGIGGGGQGNWGGQWGDCGTVIINGGIVKATGSEWGAGIGGGGNRSKHSSAIPGQGGTIIIRGGQVFAEGGNNGYGIGPGRSNAGANIEGGQGTLELGWRNRTDLITTSSVKASVKLNSKFVNISTQTVATADKVGGTTLIPYFDNSIKVDYIDSQGNRQWLNSGSYTLITDQTELSDGWYVLNNNVKIDSRINIKGEVHLVLADDCSFTASKGIYLDELNTLHIYGQSAGTGSLTAGPESNCAGIGGNEHCSCGTLEINGGNVTATAGYCGAGIGGGSQGNWADAWGHGGTVIINGGTVKATGSDWGAGIGGGGNYTTSTKAIPGKSGSVTINGGTVIATGGGEGGYGIGPGKSRANIEGEQGTLQLGWRDLTDRIYISSTNSSVTLMKDFINADTKEIVTADSVWGFVLVPEEMNKDDVPYIGADGTEQLLAGGTYTTVYDQTELKDGWYVLKRDMTIDSRISISGKVHLVLSDSATLTLPKGIKHEDANELHIYGQKEGSGSLTAGPADNYNAGIGGNIHWSGGILEINGGNVTATAGFSAAGIGGGAQGNWGGSWGSCGKVTINGGKVKATGNGTGAGIGGGGNHTSASNAIPGYGGTITINGGNVTAIGGDNGYGIGPGKSNVNVEGELGTLQLSWRNTNDSIYISSAKADVTIDGIFGISGTGERATTENLNGKYIVPARCIIIDDEIEFGKLTADKEICTYEPEEDQTVTVTAIPDEGYRIYTVTVFGASSERVGENTFTFTMPVKDAYVSGSFIIKINGDVNCDGKIDISDIVAIINTIAGNDTYKYTADVNGDGKTDISDVVAVINIMAGT